ncbi:MAG: membrane protein [Sulfuricurvum sp. PC08-66]|nr:MAG: membrane protein [Sulfuricurvum sp. PC08-66]
MLESIITWIVDTVGALGYLGILIMMFLESTFFPFPSEVVMVPAGYLAYKGEMHLGLVLLFGIAGSLLGALFNYYLARHFGRKIVLAVGHYFFFDEETLAKMERFFATHGAISTFTGRLIPVVRQYISLPAGLARMNIALFVLYTSLGAGIWVVVLTLLGYFVGQNQALIESYLHEIVLYTLLGVGVLVVLYAWWHRRKKINID